MALNFSLRSLHLFEGDGVFGRVWSIHKIIFSNSTIHHFKSYLLNLQQENRFNKIDWLVFVIFLSSWSTLQYLRLSLNVYDSQIGCVYIFIGIVWVSSTYYYSWQSNICVYVHILTYWFIIIHLLRIFTLHEPESRLRKYL